MSKRKIDRVKEAQRKLRCSTDWKFFQRAAAWLAETTGFMIGRGGIKRAVTEYRRRSKIVHWAKAFVDSILAPVSFSELKAH